MHSISSGDFRKNLAAWLARVAEDRSPLLITQEGGKPAVVLMSIEDFASCKETQYLLQSPHNAARLLKAVRELSEEDQ